MSEARIGLSLSGFLHAVLVDGRDPGEYVKIVSDTRYDNAAQCADGELVVYDGAVKNRGRELIEMLFSTGKLVQPRTQNPPMMVDRHFRRGVRIDGVPAGTHIPLVPSNRD